MGRQRDKIQTGDKEIINVCHPVYACDTKRRHVGKTPCPRAVIQGHKVRSQNGPCWHNLKRLKKRNMHTKYMYSYLVQIKRYQQGLSLQKRHFLKQTHRPKAFDPGTIKCSTNPADLPWMYFRIIIDRYIIYINIRGKEWHCCSCIPRKRKCKFITEKKKQPLCYNL